MPKSRFAQDSSTGDSAPTLLILWYNSVEGPAPHTMSPLSWSTCKGILDQAGSTSRVHFPPTIESPLPSTDIFYSSHLSVLTQNLSVLHRARVKYITTWGKQANMHKEVPPRLPSQCPMISASFMPQACDYGLLQGLSSTA